MAICPEAKRLVMESEGFRGRQYLCPAGHPTIGYGHRIRRGEMFDPDRGITRDEAESLLNSDLTMAEGFVDAMVNVPLTECQRGALVSFVFNVGPGNFEHGGPDGGPCTLLRLLNAGDYAGAAGEFGRWVKAGGKVLEGLKDRRAREQELFARGIG